MKAIALFSGGLDSQLAVKIMQKQNIEVIGMHFHNAFVGDIDDAHRAASMLSIDLITLDFHQAFMPLLSNPPHGFGKNMNPCIDCHGLMLNIAGQHMKTVGASFLVTGEVLNQRPKSQNRGALQIVENISGFPGLIVRPLSAQLLEPTIPEINGWIQRQELHAISGRSRKPQMELARQMQVVDYPSPAGGCLLTEPAFASRLKIYLLANPHATFTQLNRLKKGRHFMCFADWHVIIGRNKLENENLISIALPDDILLEVESHPGPIGLLESFGKKISADDPRLQEIAALVAGFSDARGLNQVHIKIWSGQDEPMIVKTRPLLPVSIENVIQF